MLSGLFQRPRIRSPLLKFAGMPLLALALNCRTVRADTYTADAISREISLYNAASSSLSGDAVSREISVFNAGTSSFSADAISREVSIYNTGSSGFNTDAVSREVSIFNAGASTYSADAVSREVSIYNAGMSSYLADAISREVSVFNLGHVDLTLAIGTTVVPTGLTSSLPVMFSTSLPLSGVQAAIGFPGTLLTNVSVQTTNGLIGSAFVSNNNTLYLSFASPSGATISNALTLGRVSFFAALNQPSAFLPLPVNGYGVTTQAGVAVIPNEISQNGEVVVLHTNSLLRETRSSATTVDFTLFGFSGDQYTIQYTTSLDNPIDWETAFTLTPTNYIASVPNLSITNGNVYFRAKQ